MKKSLSLVLALAMVFTMFASVAFAADATTTASTDAQTKFEALKDKGIMTGTVVDGQVVAGLDLNMDRASFAEVLVNLYNLPKVATTSSFSDVPADHWALQQIEAAKTAGYMLGNGDGTFNPDGKITLQELASALCEANGLEPVANAEVAGADDWAAGYVAAAVNAKLLASVSDYTAAATRADLVVGTYGTYENVQAEQAPTATFAATGAKELTVTFNKAIDKAKATFAVKKGSLPINISSTTVADDNMSATLSLATKLTKGDYTVTVTNPELSGTVTVEDEKVAKITFTSDKASLADGNNKVIYTGVKIWNQYNEDVTDTKRGEVSLTSASGTAAFVDSTGKVSITSTSDFVLDSKVALSALDNTNGTFATTVLTVSPVAQAATLSISSLYNADDETLDVNSTASNFKLVVTAKDQYGNDVSAADLNDDVLVYVVNAAVGLDVARDTDDNPNFSTTKIDDVDQTTLALAKSGSDLTAGTAQVVMISKTTGNKTTFDVAVKDETKVDVLNLSAPELAVVGETFDVPFTAVDQWGNAITSDSDLPDDMVTASISGVDKVNLGEDLVKVDFKQDYVTNTAKLEIDTSNIDTSDITAAKTLFLTGVTATNKVTTLTITLQAPSKPVVVTGVTDDVKTAIAKGAATTIKPEYVNVIDQYNREYTLDHYFDDAVFGANYSATIESSDGDVAGFTNGSDLKDESVTVADTADAVTVNGNDTGNATVTITLFDSSIDGTDKTITNSALTLNYKVVDVDDITDYSVEDLGTMYVGSASTDYDKAIEVNGLLKDGTKVALKPDDATYYTVTASTYGTDTGVTYISGTTDFGVLHADGTALANDIDDTTIPVTILGTTATGTKVISATVKASITAPEAASVALSDDNNTNKESDNVISITEADVNALSNYQALANAAVTVTDQYGVEITSSSKFTPVIVTNFVNSDGDSIANKAFADIVAGDTFNVTAITLNGMPITFKVVVTND